MVSITDTPHAEFLKGNVKKNIKITFQNIHRVLFLEGIIFPLLYKKIFKAFKKDFEYLKEPFDLEYIVVEKINNGYKILDGLHRVSILLNTGMKKIRVAITDST